MTVSRSQPATALLPCPICRANSAEVIHRPSGLWLVSCENDDDPFTVEIYGHDEQSAIKSWNDRAAPQGAAWQPIETAPRDGKRILATGGGLDDTIEVIAYNEKIGAWNTENYTLDDRDDEAEGYSRPSHWQPMPTPLRSSTGSDKP